MSTIKFYDGDVNQENIIIYRPKDEEYDTYFSDIILNSDWVIIAKPSTDIIEWNNKINIDDDLVIERSMIVHTIDKNTTEVPTEEEEVIAYGFPDWEINGIEEEQECIIGHLEMQNGNLFCVDRDCGAVYVEKYIFVTDLIKYFNNK